MANTELEAKLKFLRSSSQLYSFTAPSTSAYLMLQHNLESPKDTNPSRKNKRPSGTSCKGCGTILIPGWTSRISIVNKGVATKPIRKARLEKHGRRSTAGPVKVVRTDCFICYRYEETPLPPAPSRKPLGKIPDTPQTTRLVKANADPASSTSGNSPKPTAANASSKQRAKARKKGGLQAMLEKSKASATPSSGFGLDLSDFMKQG